MGNYMDSFTTLDVCVGERIDVCIEEMGGAGYLWDVGTLVQKGVLSVHKDEILPGVGNYQRISVGEQSIGEQSIRHLVLRGERAGVAMTTHSRSWLDKPDERDNRLEIHVLPREIGMRIHDFWNGRQFMFEERKLHCSGLSACHVLATDGESHGSRGNIVVSDDELRYATLQPWEPDDSLSECRELKPGSLWRHRKGSLYVIISEGQLEADASSCVTYRGVAEGDTWTRQRAEFLDGGDMPRFVRLV